MTDHTIEAHFTAESLASVGYTQASDRDIRIINAMAKALGGENAAHPMVLFEAAKLYRAIIAMREAEAKEDK